MLKLVLAFSAVAPSKFLPVRNARTNLKFSLSWKSLAFEKEGKGKAPAT